MTVTDVPVFRRELEKLATGLHGECDDKRMDWYWETLKDIPLEVFEKACAEGGREWNRFPVPAKIRELAERIKPTVYRGQAPRYSDDNEPTYACLDCQDSGLQPIVKATDRPVRWAEMPSSHADVKFRRCPCIKDNHVIQARHAAMRKISSAPTSNKWGG